MSAVVNGWNTFSKSVCNALTDSTHAFLKKYLGADCLIVTGPGGAGKSSLIKSITSEEIYIGSTLKSGTTAFRLVPAVIENKRFMLLDMPGFNTRDFDDQDIFYRLMTALAVIQPYNNFRGVLYVDPMESKRVEPAAEKILIWLYYFCGKHYMPNFTLVTTHWDGLNDDGVQDKLDRIEMWKSDSLLRDFLQRDDSIYHHGLVRDGENYQTLHVERKAVERGSLARAAIANRYMKPTELQLQVYLEIRDGVPVEETQAGRWLRNYGQIRDGHRFDQNEIPTEAPRPPHQGHEYASQNPNTRDRCDRGKPFWKKWDFDDAKLWVSLLFKAAKFYNSFSGPSFHQGPRFTAFQADAYQSDDFDLFNESCISDNVSDDSFDPPRPKSDNSGWCFMM